MKKAEKKNNVKNIAHFLFEVGILAKTPRSGFHFMGTGEQSVAEHINRTAYVGFVLASMNGKADISRVVEMCLFHDITETRISDLNYVHQKYTARDESKALKELTGGLSFGSRIEKIIEEYEGKKNLESKLAKDADQIEFLLSLKEQIDIGNARANRWVPSLIKRLKTNEAKAIAESIMNTPWDHWWSSEAEDSWWVNKS